MHGRREETLGGTRSEKGGLGPRRSSSNCEKRAWKKRASSKINGGEVKRCGCGGGRGRGAGRVGKKGGVRNGWDRTGKRGPSPKQKSRETTGKNKDWEEPKNAHNTEESPQKGGVKGEKGVNKSGGGSQEQRRLTSIQPLP